MELLLNLDDEDFHSSSKQSECDDDISYVPKQCSPNWFMKNRNSECEDTEIIEIKFRADYEFMKKNYSAAINLYTKVLEKSSNHKVTSVW